MGPYSLPISPAAVVWITPTRYSSSPTDCAIFTTCRPTHKLRPARRDGSGRTPPVKIGGSSNVGHAVRDTRARAARSAEKIHG